MTIENQHTKTDHEVIPFVFPFIIPNLDALYKSYMPFIKGGGLFLPTQQKHHLGDAIMLLLTLPHTSQEQMVPCTVIWLTPPAAQIGTPVGVGVQFNETEQNTVISIWIKNALADYPISNQPTDTL
jgi:type IV pilus assembly protein PilZ